MTLVSRERVDEVGGPVEDHKLVEGRGVVAHDSSSRYHQSPSDLERLAEVHD